MTDPTLTFSINDKTVFTCAYLLALAPYRWRTQLWPSPSMTKLFSPVLSYWRWHHIDDGPHFDLLHLFSPVVSSWRWHHVDDGPHFDLLRLYSPVLCYWCWHHIEDGPHFYLLYQWQTVFTCAQLLVLAPYRWRTPLWPSPAASPALCSPRRLGRKQFFYLSPVFLFLIRPYPFVSFSFYGSRSLSLKE